MPQRISPPPPGDSTALDLARSVFANGTKIVVRGRGACGRGTVRKVEEVPSWGPIVHYSCSRSQHQHVAPVAACEKEK